MSENARELERLLSAMTEGRLEGADRQELSDMIRSDEAARKQYLEHCQMHAMLRSAHGELHALTEPKRVSGPRFPWASAAAALLVLGASAFALIAYFVSFPSVGARLARWEGTPWLIRAGERRPAERSDELRVGDRLVTLRATTGAVRYEDGTSLQVDPNTELHWTPEGVLLRHGAILARVGSETAKDPKVFLTANARATTAGAEFEFEAGGSETRVHALTGPVRLSSWGREIDVAPGEQAAAADGDLLRWKPLCDFDFTKLDRVPAQFEQVYCKSQVLHTPERKILPARDRIRPVSGGLLVDGSHDAPGSHGLSVLRWREEAGDDLLIEAVIAGGRSWSIGFSMSGDSFEGYRIIFAVPKYPGGISIDTIHPVKHVMLAHDPRPIRFERDHVLRIERRGTRIRVWVDRALRLDTEITHPLPESRRKTFAVSNFGSPAILRSLRVWKPAAR